MATPQPPCGDTAAGPQDVPACLVGLLKPHQVEGIEFMLRCVREDDGCILAHSMGLGKTAQIVVTCATLLRLNQASTILVLTPKSTLLNWRLEFEKWGRLGKLSVANPRFRFYDCEKQARAAGKLQVLREWNTQGGVLLLGYEQYVSLVSDKLRKTQKCDDFQKILRKPGPDILVCDEGHRIKSTNTKSFKSLVQIHTRRRIILTGTPLQNHLMEYYAMINFVRKAFFSRMWFMQYFRAPIEAGQKWDASADETKMMRERAYVLSREVSSFILRKDQSILQETLPAKNEYVVFVPLSPFQVKLYSTFRKAYFANTGNKRNLLAYISLLNKIGVHPDLLREYLERRTTETGRKDWESKGWADKVFSLYRNTSQGFTPGSLFESPKLMTLLYLYFAHRNRNQKMLVFSQYVETLDLCEKLLRKADKNVSLFRLDGTCSGKSREASMTDFQKSTNSCVFLISTRAGGIGVNLNTAHCAVLLDVSFNPSHDQQAVFRCYRYGLQHPVSIYRLVANETPEGYLYNRCLAKEWMAKKVVDESAPTRDFVTTVNLSMLFDEERDPELRQPLPQHLVDHYDKERAVCLARDAVLSEVVNKLKSRSVAIRQIHRHESLLLDSAEEAPGRREERAYTEYKRSGVSELEGDESGEQPKDEDIFAMSDSDESESDVPRSKNKKRQKRARDEDDDDDDDEWAEHIEEANGELDFETAIKIASLESELLEKEQAQVRERQRMLLPSPAPPPAPTRTVPRRRMPKNENLSDYDKRFLSGLDTAPPAPASALPLVDACAPEGVLLPDTAHQPHQECAQGAADALSASLGRALKQAALGKQPSPAQGPADPPRRITPDSLAAALGSVPRVEPPASDDNYLSSLLKEMQAPPAPTPAGPPAAAGAGVAGVPNAAAPAPPPAAAPAPAPPAAGRATQPAARAPRTQPTRPTRPTQPTVSQEDADLEKAIALSLREAAGQQPAPEGDTDLELALRLSQEEAAGGSQGVERLPATASAAERAAAMMDEEDDEDDDGMPFPPPLPPQAHPRAAGTAMPPPAPAAQQSVQSILDSDFGVPPGAVDEDMFDFEDATVPARLEVPPAVYVQEAQKDLRKRKRTREKKKDKKRESKKGKRRRRIVDEDSEEGAGEAEAEEYDDDDDEMQAAIAASQSMAESGAMSAMERLQNTMSQAQIDAFLAS